MNDGGLAFPCGGGPMFGFHASPGMSLRDYFAGQAIIDVRIRNHIAKAFGHIAEEHSPADAAKEAYAIADAMLKERKV